MVYGKIVIVQDAKSSPAKEYGLPKSMGLIVLFTCLLLISSTPILAQTPGEFGVDRSNLTKENEADQVKTMQGIHALHATWFRDVLFAAAQPTPAFVNEVKLAKQNNLKFLANVLPGKADFAEGYQAPNAGEDFKRRCGWSSGSSELSRLDSEKFTQHFRLQLDAVKAANLTIDAFEIGNEEDWICFNGDVPNGRVATQQDFMKAVRAYAHFLRAAAEVIHGAHYFPNAKIITFGMAHGSDKWDKPPNQHHFSNPARMIAALRNLDGFNYLDNSTYHVDGYGSHVYPEADNVQQSMTEIIRQDASVLGQDKPFWITEWGLEAKKFPNKQGQSRGEAIRVFCATLDKLHVPFGPPFYYAYSGGGSKGLTDASGALLPDGKAVSACLH
jgi:hypothetical protein